MLHLFVLRDIKETTISCNNYSKRDGCYIIETTTPDKTKQIQIKIPFDSVLLIRTEIDVDVPKENIDVPKV